MTGPAVNSIKRFAPADLRGIAGRPLLAGHETTRAANHTWCGRTWGRGRTGRWLLGRDAGGGGNEAQRAYCNKVALESNLKLHHQTYVRICPWDCEQFEELRQPPCGTIRSDLGAFLWKEAVSNAMDGQEVTGSTGVLFQLVAQPHHVSVNSAGVRIGFVSPDGIQNDLAR